MSSGRAATLPVQQRQHFCGCANCAEHFAKFQEAALEPRPLPSDVIEDCIAILVHEAEAKTALVLCSRGDDDDDDDEPQSRREEVIKRLLESDLQGEIHLYAFYNERAKALGFQRDLFRCRCGGSHDVRGHWRYE